MYSARLLSFTQQRLLPVRYSLSRAISRTTDKKAQILRLTFLYSCLPIKACCSFLFPMGCPPCHSLLNQSVKHRTCNVGREVIVYRYGLYFSLVLVSDGKIITNFVMFQINV